VHCKSWHKYVLCENWQLVCQSFLFLLQMAISADQLYKFLVLVAELKPDLQGESSKKDLVDGWAFVSLYPECMRHASSSSALWI
jgi:hypothetical protein